MPSNLGQEMSGGKREGAGRKPLPWESERFTVLLPKGWKAKMEKAGNPSELVRSIIAQALGFKYTPVRNAEQDESEDLGALKRRTDPKTGPSGSGPSVNEPLEFGPETEG